MLFATFRLMNERIKMCLGVIEQLVRSGSQGESGTLFNSNVLAGIHIQIVMYDKTSRSHLSPVGLCAHQSRMEASNSDACAFM